MMLRSIYFVVVVVVLFVCLLISGAQLNITSVILDPGTKMMMIYLFVYFISSLHLYLY